MENARNRSRFSGSVQAAVAGELRAMAGELGATRFLGYEGRGTTGEGVVKAILVAGQRVQHAPAGAAVRLMFDQTPFYAESGGQIGDTGEVTTETAAVRIDDTKKPAGDVHVLFGEVIRG